MMIIAVVMCSSPENGTNTEPIPDDLQGGIPYPGSYTYSCKEGYMTSDELCTVCLLNGNLSLATPPVCTRKYLRSFYVLELFILK